MHSHNGSLTIRLHLLGGVDARTAGGAPVGELVNQPKRLAFVAYLALAPERRARRRDDLLALFFPESSEGPARNALNQTVYRLRAVLGEDALISNEQEIRLDPERVWCDAAEVRAAAAAGDDVRVLSLYRGNLLESFHARGTANEFEMWLARERDELRDIAVRSAWRLSDADSAAGNVTSAAHWGRTAVRLAPMRDDGVKRLMLLLESLGDRSGALRAYEEYARRMVDEFELEPSADLSELATSLRERPAPPVIPAPGAIGASASPERPRTRMGAMIGGAVLFVALSVWALVARDARESVPVLAVGDISLANIPDTLAPVEFLLSTSLARIEGLSVVTEERVREVSVQLGKSGEGADGRRRAGLQAGATEVIEGMLSRRGETYRLDLRRVDRAGRAASGHTIEANDLLDLADLATEQIAKDLGLRAPAARVYASSASLVAFRLYQQGIDALYSDAPGGARRLFEAALAEDSTFAMAMYQLAMTTSEDRELLFAKARELAANSPLRERLLITARSMLAVSEPGALAVAESLATRYPRDPEATMVYGSALLGESKYLEASRWFRRAADLDTLSIRSSDLQCRACDARRQMREALLFADSTAAAEREAREWVRRNPESRHAWSELGQTLEQLERFDEAEQAFARAPGSRVDRDMTGAWIRQLRFQDVDLHWQNELRTGDIETRKSAHWGSYISMRTQGRLRDALVHARAFRDLQGDSLLEGIALYELGRFHEAARIHEKHAARWAGNTTPVFARRRAWHLAHAAASYAALRDTMMLRQIEDTVRIYGSRSAARGDRQLHHYIRGLRLRVQGNEREAARAFEASVGSLSDGYVREKLELARASMASGNPKRAITVLRATLRGPISAGGLYASRTELMELLGDAYVLDQQPDSARIMYARVLETWKAADPMLQPRVSGVRARLNALQPDRSVRPE